MANQKITLASLNLDTEGLVNAAKQSEQAITSLKKALDQLRASGASASADFKRMEEQLATLNAIYKVQQEALTKLNKKQEAATKSAKKAAKTNTVLGKAITKTAKSVDDLNDELEDAADAMDDLKDEAADAKDALDDLNDSLDENETKSAGSGSASKKLGKTFTDYKSQVSESFDKINLLNGGLGGFISRAQEAGGTGPLLSSALQGMTSGIVGMTKASLSFIATPIGAVIAAIAIVIALVKNAMDSGSASAKKITKIFDTFTAITDGLMKLLEPLGEFLIDGIAAGFELAGKAAEAAMGFISDGLRFLGFNDAAEGVKTFTEEVKENAAETQRLKDAQEELTKQTTAQEIANEKAKQKISELTDKVNDQTLSEEERLKTLQELSKVEKQNLNERKKLADAAYNNAVANAAKGKYLSDEEKRQLQESGVAYAQKLMAVKGFTQEEIDALKDAQLERMRLSSEEIALTKNTAEQANTIRQQNLDAEHEARQERIEKEKERLSDYAKQLDLELQLFMQKQSQKEMSIEEELAYLKEVEAKQIAIAQAEFAASEKTKNDELALEIRLGEIKAETAKSQADAAVANANRELEAYKQKNQTLINEDTELTKELVKQENERLENIKNKSLEALAIALKTNEDIIAAKKAKNQALTDADLEYLEQKKALENEYQEQQRTNNEALEEEEKAKKVAKQEAELQEKIENAATEYEQQRIIEEERYAQTLAQLEERRANEKLSDDQYKALLLEEEKNHAANKQKIDKAESDNKLELAKGLYSNLATILGKESKAGKAMAIAQATIDTYQSATAAYKAMAGIPVVGPALGAVAAGAAVVTGIKNVKKIASTKPPKAEKGALFNIGGNRHSTGGTLFTGADGTQFEAEQGELIGVMNRNAAQHFMAFNNAFPAGGSSPSASNYFENGGIVSRSIATPGLNTDELAAKIAEANSTMPAPVVSVEDIITEGESYVQVRESADF
ncbi:hypothetical protein [Flavobacterium litorale]|uniref:Uncharacterized protein n=1 Tax=Flavobacterium litorale TaxID=2856519 RepID=A0ABX8V8T4_9FLAO|nr:hypothetical protein [Flavobacterium litorale]QYJ68927.1 hypothetical protein K1I41_03315 [Flavobacterium litorale]